MYLRVILIVCLGLFAAAPAQAYRFGTDENIHKIQDVKYKGSQGEELYLGYMTRVPNFMLGLYLEDAGYVLGISGQSSRFYHMPQGDELKSLQRTGLLPDPLPPYEIGTLDYVMGYSLWWALGLVALFMLIGHIRKKPAETTSATPAPPASPPPT